VNILVRKAGKIRDWTQRGNPLGGIVQSGALSQSNWRRGKVLRQWWGSCGWRQDHCQRGRGLTGPLDRRWRVRAVTQSSGLLVCGTQHGSTWSKEGRRLLALCPWKHLHCSSKDGIPLLQHPDFTPLILKSPHSKTKSKWEVKVRVLRRDNLTQVQGGLGPHLQAAGQTGLGWKTHPANHRSVADTQADTEPRLKHRLTELLQYLH
jgi:hypothetical protein